MLYVICFNWLSFCCFCHPVHLKTTTLRMKRFLGDSGLVYNISLHFSFFSRVNSTCHCNKADERGSLSNGSDLLP